MTNDTLNKLLKQRHKHKYDMKEDESWYELAAKYAQYIDSRTARRVKDKFKEAPVPNKKQISKSLILEMMAETWARGDDKTIEDVVNEIWNEYMS